MAPRDAYNRRDRRWQPNDRQRAVLDLLAEGKTNPQIAVRLGITLDGAKWHVSELLVATGWSDRLALASWWRESRSQRREGQLPILLSWRTLVAGAASFVALAGIVLAALSFASSGDNTAGRVAREELVLFPDVASQDALAVETAVPDAQACPLGGGDLRSVEPTEVSGQGLVRVGRSFFAEGCPILVANRDDRAFVRVPLDAEVSIGGAELPWISAPWRSEWRDIEIAGGALTVLVSHNESYAGPGMEVVLQAWDADRRVYQLAVDSEGGLWASPEPWPATVVFEQWTGEMVQTSNAKVVGRLLPSDPPNLDDWAKPVFYFTSCFGDSCRISVRPGEPLVAPVEGMVRCITGEDAEVDDAGRPIGEIELDTGEYTLRFVELYTSEPNSGGDKSCATREVEQGDRIGSHYHYAILAIAPDGAPLSVAVSQDGTLYVGNFYADPECPCTTGH